MAICPEKDEAELHEKEAGHNTGGCPDKSPREETNDLPSTYYKENPNRTPTKNGPKKKPKFKVRDIYECFTGHDDHAGCDVNPDVPACPDGSRPITRQIYSTKNVFVRQYQYCPGDEPPKDLPKEGFVEQIRITLEKFRSFPIKGSNVQSSPNKFSLRNGHTHFWASEETQEFNSNLSGSDVRIKAIPIQWNWNYGDGATRNLNFPGEAMPSHTLREETKTSHSYTKTGKFGVRVTTLYRGEFSVDGGPWEAIPGQAAVPSNTLPMDVWRTKKELIAND
ncbi:hypothetical protein [Arthrobacter sp. S41]|uniref:hypothetical protein n=1 Tax=Arthrobacter sp. S41 TaxID=2509721 RepID=UPI0010358172|nr:hypothetical protein [Arthrobacter sp. S41]TAP27564.1 hypothetical protein EYR88_04250 [Arthrobacter sp. S41]